MLLLVDFLGSLNFLTGLRMFLLHITTTWPYLHPLLPGLYYFLLSSTTAVWEKISTSNASKCLENFSSYIALITLCLSALAYFFFFHVTLWNIHTWHEIYQCVRLFSKCSSHKHRKQLAEIFSKPSPSGFLLSTTHKKIRKKWKQSIRKMEQMWLKEKDLCWGTFVSDYWGFSYAPRQSTCPNKADKAVGFWISSFRLQFLLACAMSYAALVMY